MSIATTESARTAIQTSAPSRRTASRTSITRLEGRRSHGTPNPLLIEEVVDPIAVYDGLCDTCHGYPADHTATDAATCPSCGVASEEYALSLKMNLVLEDMAGMQRLLDVVLDID